MEKKRDTKKEFKNLFSKLCKTRSDWQVWSDLMSVFACLVSNSVDRSPKHFEKRKKEYEQCIERLGSKEVPLQMLMLIAEAYEENMEQDFPGAIYMELKLNNHWKGQYFTPFDICNAMARITLGDLETAIRKHGWSSVCDSCIGGGAMLIAAANHAKSRGIDYQNHVLFVGQDVDRVVAQMAYIQLSLLG